MSSGEAIDDKKKITYYICNAMLKSSRHTQTHTHRERLTKMDKFIRLAALFDMSKQINNFVLI